MDETVLDNLTVAVMAINNDFIITVANKMCKTILGIEPEEALGKNIDEFFNHPPEFTRTLQHTLEKEENFRYDVFPYTWGSYKKTLSQRSTLLKDNEGNTTGAMIEFEDITEEHNQRMEMRKIMGEMAATLIPLYQGVGLLPMKSLPYEVAAGDFMDIAEKVMSQCVSSKVQHLIIDASSVLNVNQLPNVGYFVKVADGFELLGIKVYLTGLRPQVVLQVIQSGAELNLPSYANVHQVLDILKR